METKLNQTLEVETKPAYDRELRLVPAKRKLSQTIFGENDTLARKR